MQVTTGNNKATDFVLRCAVSGLFLADADSQFNVISVTCKAEQALALTDGAAAEKARKFMLALYPSFDWRAVERDAHTEKQQAVFHIKQAA